MMFRAVAVATLITVCVSIRANEVAPVQLAHLEMFPQEMVDSPSIQLVGCEQSCSGGCDSIRDSCNPCSFPAGCYGGLDVVFAKPYFTDGVGSTSPRYEFEASPRLTLGYRGESGFGFRGRYWYFEQHSHRGAGFAIPPGSRVKLEMDAFDLEVTKTLGWNRVHAQVFGGLRYAQIDQGVTANAFDYDARTQIEGWGPTLGIDSLVPITSRCAFVANARYSALFGTSLANNSDFPARDDAGFSSIETQLGLQGQRHTSCGTVRLSGLVETQNWVSAAEQPSSIGSTPDEDLLMLGFVLRLEYLH